jgi:tetratricopeptide (TPR) repeat protein
MHVFFIAATVVMSFLAIGFVAMPLAKNKRQFGLLGVAVALPLFATSMYWLVGTPRAATLATSAHADQPGTAAQRNKTVGSVASMVDGLAARLEANPQDGGSWLLLARSYNHLGRTSDAVDAYQQAVALGEYDEELAALAGSSKSVVSGPRISGNVSLAASAEDIVLPTDTVFVFARAIDGPPMPVAVLQRPASQLPLDFVLDDNLALSADAKLSNVERVVVSARISRSGIATDALQTLEARSGEVLVGDAQYLNLIVR